MKENMEENKRSSGRPRNESSKAAIFRTTIKLLEQSSFSSLTIEGIAKDAGVSKATIYRWWKSKEDLLLSIFLEVTDSNVTFNPSLSLDANFRQIIIELSNVLASPLGKSILTAIIENKDLFQTLHVRFFEPRRLEAKHILEMGIRKGMIQPHINLDIALDMLFSPIYIKILFYKESIDETFIHDLICHFMNGITTR